MDANAARGIASRRRESNAGVQHPAELRQAPADTKTVRAPRTPRPVLAPRQPAPVLQPRPPRSPRNIERQVEAMERKVFEERDNKPEPIEPALQVAVAGRVTRSPNSARKTPEPFTSLSPTWDVLVRLDKKYRKAAELEALDLEEEGVLVKEGREYRITAFVRYVLEREFERLREKHGK